MNVTKPSVESESFSSFPNILTTEDLSIPSDDSLKFDESFMRLQIDYSVTIEKIKTLINFTKHQAEFAASLGEEFYKRLQVNFFEDRNKFCRGLSELSLNVHSLFAKSSTTLPPFMDLLSKRISDTDRDLSRLCICLDTNCGYPLSYTQEFKLRLFGHVSLETENKELKEMSTEKISEKFLSSLSFETLGFDSKKVSEIKAFELHPDIDLTLKEDLLPTHVKIENFWKGEQPKLAAAILILSENKAQLNFPILSKSFEPKIELILANLAVAEESALNLSKFNLLVDHALKLLARAESASQKLSKILDAGLDVVLCHEKRSRLANLLQIRLKHISIQSNAYLSSLNNRIERIRNDIYTT